MGCTASSPKVVRIETYPDEDDETKRSRRRDAAITAQQEVDRLYDKDKVKMLLLGAGESGKSTIFKQMRIIYGLPKTDEDLRMYGVIVRSNIVTAVRKICILTRELGYEIRLDKESAAPDLQGVSGMTPREAYDEIVAHVVDCTAKESFPDIPKEQADQDWVGKSKRAGVQANKDAQQFLQHVEAIGVLWKVRWVFFCFHLHYSACSHS